VSQREGRQMCGSGPHVVGERWVATKLVMTNVSGGMMYSVPCMVKV